MTLAPCLWRSTFNTSIRTSHIKRSLWTRVSSQGSSLKTCIDDCLSTQLQTKQTKTPTVCVALVSKSFASHEYKEAMTYLSQQLGTDTQTMGCIVDRTPTGKGVSLLVGYDEQIQPFQLLDGPGRQKARSISVGRWGQLHDFDRFKYQDNTLDTVGWSSFDTISQPPQRQQQVTSVLPPQPQQQDPPSFIFMLSDHEPDQLLQSFDQLYPRVPKLGMVAASTPFLTGTPYTLFYQDQTMDAGIIGFAAYGSNNKANGKTQSDIMPRIEYPYLETLGSPLSITRARGNIILDLDDQGATRLLLNLINQVNVSKEEQFYLGIYPLDDNNDDNDDTMTVGRITSGDPARGNMAVDTTLDLQVGQRVQFMRQRKDSDVNPQDLLLSSCQDNTMIFGVVDLDHSVDALPTNSDSGSDVGNRKVLTNTFGATSENGVIVGQPGRSSQLHQVAFSKMTVTGTL